MNKKLAIASAMLAMTTTAAAENVEGVDKMICAAAQAQICLETGECFTATPFTEVIARAAAASGGFKPQIHPDKAMTARP